MGPFLHPAKRILLLSTVTPRARIKLPLRPVALAHVMHSPLLPLTVSFEKYLFRGRLLHGLSGVNVTGNRA